MRHLQQPHTLRKHADLQHNINEMMIAIKLHHTDMSKENPEAVAKAKASCMKPTWENALELLNKAYKALDEQRYDPVKY